MSEDPNTHGPWKLKELAALGARVLAEGDPVQGDSRRVRWRPNTRLLRYYTTLGLLDRPLEMRGRTAYYGMRHLLQLLAIKQLQARDLSLAEIQRRLAGLPNRELARLAGLPPGWTPEHDPGCPAPSPEEPAAPEPAPAEPDGGRFWERAPRAPASSPPPPPEVAPLGEISHGLALGPGACLLLDRRLLERLDPGALEEAAGPLMELIREATAANPPWSGRSRTASAAGADDPPPPSREDEE